MKDSFNLYLSILVPIYRVRIEEQLPLEEGKSYPSYINSYEQQFEDLDIPDFVKKLNSQPRKRKYTKVQAVSASGTRGKE